VVSRVRYETYLGGRLLKVTAQVEVPDFIGPPFASHEEAVAASQEYRAGHPLPGQPALKDGLVPTVDGEHWWEMDRHRVGEDVAMAMLATGGQFSGEYHHGLPVSDQRLLWYLVARIIETGGEVVVPADVAARIPQRPRLVISRDDTSGAFTLEARR
jgi:hypothetical protein